MENCPEIAAGRFSDGFYYINIYLIIDPTISPYFTRHITMTDRSLPKTEIMRGEKTVASLFTGGHSGFCYPFRYVWREGQGSGVKVLFSVPKRNFKRAVKRNLLRRRMREAYRLNKVSLSGAAATKDKQLELAIIYSAKELHDFKTIHNGIGRILGQIVERL